MKVTEFSELAAVMMKRKRVRLKDVAQRIETSSVYARQVIDGTTQGKEAREHRLKIADYLGIDHKYVDL